jgi:hypothetical protein
MLQEIIDQGFHVRRFGVPNNPVYDSDEISNQPVRLRRACGKRRASLNFRRADVKAAFAEIPTALPFSISITRRRFPVPELFELAARKVIHTVEQFLRESDSFTAVQSQNSLFNRQ